MKTIVNIYLEFDEIEVLSNNEFIGLALSQLGKINVEHVRSIKDCHILFLHLKMPINDLQLPFNINKKK